MRTVIQRVKHAEVNIDGQLHSHIGHGLLVFIGIEEADTRDDVDYLVGKIARLRIFDDPNGVMNLDVQQTSGDVLVVSQFTLQASTRKGNRPSYIRAAREEISKPLYEEFLAAMGDALGKSVPSGTFGADMQIELLNDGPVTIWIDSREK